jgi:hypothetical protein
MVMMKMKSDNWGCLFAVIAFMVLGWAVFAEEITTENLLPNGTNNASNYQTVDTSIPNVTTNGFNTTGNIRNWGQEIETTGTGGINVTGSLVGITTGEDTTNQDKLDNGVTLNSTTVVQNCEYQGSNWQCGQAKPGQDTYTTTVSILDADGNVLSTVNQIRNNDAGYGSNAYKYSDTVTYTGTGSNQFYWAWEGVDLGYTQYNTNLGGPNLLGAKLTMTYDNVVLQAETIEEIEEVIDEFIEWEQEFTEPVIEPPVAFVPLVFEETFLEEFEEFLLEEPQTIVILEEEFEALEEEFEEVEILQVFGGPEIVEEPQEEETITEPAMEIAAASIMEEQGKPTETTPVETVSEEIASEPSGPSSEPVALTEPQEESEEEEYNEPTVTTETFASNETSEEENAVEKPQGETSSIQAEVKVEEKETPDIKVNVETITAKVETIVKDVDKQLAVINVVTQRVMVSASPNLSNYTAANADLFQPQVFYSPREYSESVDLSVYESEIYTDADVVKQIVMNDPVYKYQENLRKAKFNRIEAERQLLEIRGY